METEVKKTIQKLQQYVPVEYWKIFDWETIYNRREEVTENIYSYNVFLYHICLNNENRPVEYGRQYIIDGMVFIDENEDSTQGAGTYTYIGDL